MKYHSRSPYLRRGWGGWRRLGCRVGDSGVRLGVRARGRGEVRGDMDETPLGHDPSTSAAAPGPPRRRRARRVVLAGAGVLVLALGVFVGAFAVDAMRMNEAAATLMGSAPAAQSALADGDPQVLEAAVGDLTGSAADFASATSGPHWWVAAHMPWVRDQVRPLMAAGRAVDAVASEALEPLVSVGGLSVLEEPPIEAGRLDPSFLEPYREPLARASHALEAQQDALADVDLDRTVDAVASRFTQLESELGELADMIDGASVTAELLPAMLGGEGSRTYAVILQNNAEPRASGGIPGAVLMVTVDDGAPTLGAYFSAADLLNGHPIEGVTEEELAQFGWEMAVYPHDATFTPQFPRTAQLMSTFVERETGEAPDGVISFDPVALGYMLGSAEPREIEGIEIDGANLASVMLNQAYFEFEDARAQDAFFAQAAGVLFQDILSGGSSSMQGLRRALEEGRFAVWSADPGEQELLAPTSAGGDMLRDDVWAGVFLNDASGTKMGYYVDVSVAVGACGMEVTVSHGFEGDVADLPDYVAEGVGLVPRGVFSGSLLVFPPVSGSVASVEVDGQESFFGVGVLAGRQLLELPVTLEPGASTAVSVVWAGAAEMPDVGAIAVTPGARGSTVELLPAEAC